MSKASVRKSYKFKFSFFVMIIFFCSIISTLGYTLFNNIIQIGKLNKEKSDLNNKIISLKEEQSSLEADIKMLSDSSYIARYAREKYFYSKEGELIIRMDD